MESASGLEWLSGIHVQPERYVGKWQARQYRTIKGEMVDGEMRWNETAIGARAMRTKCWASCCTMGRRCAQSRSAWKLFTYDWTAATPGEHTIVSRVTDVNGRMQPTAEDLKGKVTFLENNQQAPRTVRIS